MADNIKVLLGQFLKNRELHPDTSSDPFSPGDQPPVVNKDFLSKVFLPQILSQPATIPFEPAPPLSKPAGLSPIIAPKTPLEGITARQPSLPIVLSRPPAGPIAIADPPLSRVAGEQPHPNSPLTRVAAEQPHPNSPLTQIANQQPHPNSPLVHPPDLSNFFKRDQPKHSENVNQSVNFTPILTPILSDSLVQPAQGPSGPAEFGKDGLKPFVLGTANQIHQVPPSVRAQDPGTIISQVRPPGNIANFNPNNDLDQTAFKPYGPTGFIGPTKGPTQGPPTMIGTLNQSSGLIPVPAVRQFGENPLGNPFDIKSDSKGGSFHISQVEPVRKTLSPDSQFYSLNQKNQFNLKLQQIDKTLYTYLKTVGDGNTMSLTTEFGNPNGDQFAPAVGGPFGMAGGQSWNPILFAKNVVRLGVHLKLGLITFGAIQLGLNLLNRTTDNGTRVSIWNPLVLANPPLLQNFIPSTIGNIFNINKHSDSISDGNDRLKKIGDGTYTDFQIYSYPPFFNIDTKIGSIKGPLGAVASFLFPRIYGAASQDDSIIRGGQSGGKITDLGQPIIQQGLNTRNTYTSGQTVTDNATYSVATLVDEVLNGKADLLVKDTTLPTLDTNSRLRFPNNGKTTFSTGDGLGKLFFNPDAGKLSYPHEWQPKPDIATTRGKPLIQGKLEKAAFPRGIIPADFNADNNQGFILHSVDDKSGASGIIDDDEAYVPLSFTDMRPIQGSLRTVYFRPFITDFKENFSPDWNKQHYIGRTDWVATYQSTGRTVSLSFQLHAFGPEDLDIIHAKLNWLVSMVYPEFDSDLVFFSGPVVRMRIGDIISSSPGRGLPGIIENLDFDYGGSIWELKKNFKVPRSVKVSMQFIVLHDRPIGRGGVGKFGGLGQIDGNGVFSNDTTNSISSTTNTKVKFPQVQGGFPASFRGYPSDFNDYDDGSGKVTNTKAGT